MKAVSVLISAVLLIAISIAAIAIVLSIGVPAIERAQEAALISEAKAVLGKIDSSVREVLAEGSGSQRVLTVSTTGGDYYVDKTSDSIYFEIINPVSKVVDEGVNYTNGNLRIFRNNKTLNITITPNADILTDAHWTKGTFKIAAKNEGYNNTAEKQKLTVKVVK